MMTELIDEFGAEPLFQFVKVVGQAPVPFQIKTVDVGGVGSFDVVMLVFGSSPPITGMRERLELDVLSGSPLPFSLPKLNRGLPPSS